MSQIQIISAEDFTAKLKNDALGSALILDVRSQAEIDAYHLSAGHFQMPLHEIDVGKLKEQNAEEIYVLCKMGGRAMKAAEYLAQAGFENLIVIDGGMQGCKTHGADIKGDNINPSEEDTAKLAQEAQKSVQTFIG